MGNRVSRETRQKAAQPLPCSQLPLPPSGTTAAPAPVTNGAAIKKGVGAWHFDHIDAAIADVNVAWFYTWEAGPKWFKPPAGCEFVPMIWGWQHVTAPHLVEAQASGATLLSFNEPDLIGQANMSVQQAIDLWPQLVSTGMRLGSPAVSTHADKPGGWFDQFMTQAAARGLRVDFVCVHWYAQGVVVDDEVKNLRSYLQAVYERYRRPIWLTEFAMIRWTSATTAAFPSWDQQAAFARAVVPMLQALPYVERFAWFSLPPWRNFGGEPTNNLYNEDGTPTPVGAVYRELN